MKLKLKETLGRIINELYETHDMIKSQTFTYANSTTLASGEVKSISGNDFNYTVPDGYELLGIKSMYVSSSAVDIVQCRLAATTAPFVRVRNGGNTGMTSFTVYVTVNFIKARYME